MPDAYTTLWTQDRCRAMREQGREGTPLTLLYGGPHQSEPSFMRAGVKPGDTIYPIRLLKGVVYIIARMQVDQVLSLQAFIDRTPGDFARIEHGRWPSVTFGRYLEVNPEQRYLAPTCTEEVVLAANSTPQRLDIPIPPAVLERLRYRSQRRERGVKYLENGRLKNIASIQGIYRLAPSSAADFEAIMEAASAPTR